MTIAIGYVIGAVVLAFLSGLLLGAVVGLSHRRPPAVVPPSTKLDDMLTTPEEDLTTKDYVDGQVARPSILDGMPRFGRPEIVIYQPADWEEDLVCNGGSCPMPQLAPGQAIWLIPIPDGHLPFCLDCSPAPLRAHV